MSGLLRALVAHEYALDMRRGSVCSCGFVPTIEPESLRTQQDYHREHTAGVVLGWVEARLDDDDVLQAVCEAIALTTGEIDCGETTAALAAVKAALRADS